MTHGRGCPKSMLLLGPEVDLPRPIIPLETLTEGETMFPSGPAGREGLRSPAGGHPPAPLGSLGMTQSSLGVAACGYIQRKRDGGLCGFQVSSCWVC